MPVLWPNVVHNYSNDILEYDMAENILPIPCDHKYDVTGSLCENCDKFAIDRMLPKIDMGDLLVIHDAGAHGFSMGYNYNGKLRSAEVLLKEDGSTQLIRRAETPDDYFRTFDCFDILKDMKHPERK